MQREIGTNPFRLAQAKSRWLYLRPEWRAVTGSLVVVSFVLDMVEAELKYREGRTQQTEAFIDFVVWQGDIIFTAFFLGEMAVNYVAHWDRPWAWICKPWNILDMTLNLLSICSFFVGEDVLRMLRPIRVFRVVRLFRRFKSLNRIVTALGMALGPVSSAMALLIITTCGFPVLATTLFREDNPEFFNDFSTSMFTMFQISSGDSWASSIVRSLFASDDPEFVQERGHARTSRSISVFFVIYFVVAGIILVNVVVAVLLGARCSCDVMLS